VVLGKWSAGKRDPGKRDSGNSESGLCVFDLICIRALGQWGNCLRENVIQGIGPQGMVIKENVPNPLKDTSYTFQEFLFSESFN
jgi:hypothetical protein